MGIDWLLVISCIIGLTVCIGGGLFAQTPSGRTKSTSV